MTGILLVDKPEGLTSHQVVARLRRLLHIKKIGHAGTLDPLATGLLVALLGRATRACDTVMGGDKSYTAAFRLGLTTDTQDITGTVQTRHTGPLPGLMEIEACLPTFTGDIEQIPPMTSAIKQGGKKLYELARKGIEVERPSRRIRVDAIRMEPLMDTDEPGADFVLHVDCSKGTYVRTLIHDIGQVLGCGATLTALRRTRCAPFTVADALTLEEIEVHLRAGDMATRVLGVDGLFANHPAVWVNEEGETLVRHGAPVPFLLAQKMVPKPLESKDEQVSPTCLDAPLWRVYNVRGDFLMLARRVGGMEPTLIVEKTFFEVEPKLAPCAGLNTEGGGSHG